MRPATDPPDGAKEMGDKVPSGNGGCPGMHRRDWSPKKAISSRPVPDILFYAIRIKEISRD